MSALDRLRKKQETKIKTYFVIWTYIANHSEKPFMFKAKNPAEAIEKLFKYYDNPEFREKAQVYVTTEIFCYNENGYVDCTWM